MTDKKIAAGLLALCLAAAAGPALADEVKGTIVNGQGATIGTVTATDGPKGGVLLYIEATQLPPGFHGLHLHAVGTCTGPEFTSAGAHVGAPAEKHGLLNPEGHDHGDLPNLWVAGDGTAKAEIYTGFVAVKAGADSLLDADGSALVIHRDRDDHVTQPIGGAGPRIGCAVLKRG
jgi:Cu-Zn family superoxide dismutase